MKKKVKIYILILFSFFYFSAKKSFAAGTIGVSGADFLTLGIGSSALAQGEAFTASIGDLNVLYYNPAALSTLKIPELTFMHLEGLLDSRLENITFAWPLYRGFIAVSNTAFWVPPFAKIDISGNEVGSVNFCNNAFTVGYGLNLKYIEVGASLKYIYQRIDTMNLNSVACDLGVLRKFYLYSPFKTLTKNFILGAALRNLGTKAGNYPLPRHISFGLCYYPVEWLNFKMTAEEDLISHNDLFDFVYGFSESFRLKMGLELNYKNLLFLRGGWRFNDGGGYTAGLGINYAIKNIGFSLDTAVFDAGEFGTQFSVNLTFKLIPKVISEKDRQKSEDYYQRGINLFVGDDLDGAINHFERSKEYDPYHKNIKQKIKDLKQIKNLKESNKKYQEEIEQKR